MQFVLAPFDVSVSMLSCNAVPPDVEIFFVIIPRYLRVSTKSHTCKRPTCRKDTKAVEHLEWIDTHHWVFPGSLSEVCQTVSRIRYRGDTTNNFSSFINSSKQKVDKHGYQLIEC